MTEERVNPKTGEITVSQSRSVTSWSPDQITLLKKTVASGLDENEFKVFMHVAVHSNLDPFKKQIYAIKRGGKMTIQTGIDGFASLAARTGELAGMDAPVFSYDPDGRLVSVAITIYRLVQGQRCPFTAMAFVDEYYVDNNLMWKTKTHTMIAKCCRALCFRMAFPDELSGLYTGDEMEQAGGQPAPIDVPLGDDDIQTTPDGAPIVKVERPRPDLKMAPETPKPTRPATGTPSTAQIKYLKDSYNSLSKSGKLSSISQSVEAILARAVNGQSITMQDWSLANSEITRYL